MIPKTPKQVFRVDCANGIFRSPRGMGGYRSDELGEMRREQKKYYFSVRHGLTLTFHKTCKCKGWVTGHVHILIDQMNQMLK